MQLEGIIWRCLGSFVLFDLPPETLTSLPRLFVCHTSQLYPCVNTCLKLNGHVTNYRNPRFVVETVRANFKEYHLTRHVPLPRY